MMVRTVGRRRVRRALTAAMRISALTALVRGIEEGDALVDGGQQDASRILDRNMPRAGMPPVRIGELGRANQHLLR